MNKQKLVSVLTLLFVLVIAGCGGDPRTPEEVFNSAYAAKEKGDHDTALMEFGILLEKVDSGEAPLSSQELSDVYSLISLSHSAKGDYQAAVADLDEAIKLQPASAILYVTRAQAYFHLGDEARMKQDMEKAQGLGFDINQLAE